MSGSPRCKHARLVGREVVKLSASVSLQVCVESDTTVKISPHLPRIYQQFLPDQDSAPKFAARTARRGTRGQWETRSANTGGGATAARTAIVTQYHVYNARVLTHFTL